MRETVKRFLLILILIYQRGISPWLGSNCRFYPSCSEWAQQALETYGVLKGTTLALRRFLSCHPLHPGGYHPLKENG